MNELNFSLTTLGEAKIPSPLTKTHFERNNSKVGYFKDPEDACEYNNKYKKHAAFVKAGPYKNIYHTPTWTRAAILTAGGLCPGLNDVIEGLTISLEHRYKISSIIGIPYGYRGLNPEFGYEPIKLTSEVVDGIHQQGGTILGSSRGRQPEDIMVDTLNRMNINILFCIGGDGTLRCAHDIHLEAKKRGLNISVIGIPKTIDNDISFIERSFGFETAVYAANDIVTHAHNEAKGAVNGVGLIRLMGRDSGFISAYASLGNCDVNYCLIPEEKFTLEKGTNAFLPHLLQRLRKRKHAVIVVAEGAGQELMEGQDQMKDASGNVIHADIGLFLKKQINDYAKKNNVEINLKYFDPSYSIRSKAALGTDAVFCRMLAQNAAAAAMNGFTDAVVGYWNDEFTVVPITLATSKRKKIDVKGPLWRSVLSTTWPT